MAEDTTRTSNRKLNSGASEYNAISFMMEQQMKGSINTCIPVRVETCTKPGPDGAAGYVSATPLVMQRGADGNSLAPVALPKLPFFRLCAGTAAIVMDPQPGDVGLAVFSQQDASNLEAGKNDPVQAGSFRSFDMSDGFYIGGILGNAPTVYCELEQDKGITLKTPSNTITIDKDGGLVSVDAKTKLTINAPDIELVGAVKIDGATTTTSTITAGGNVSATGNVSASGNVSAGGDFSGSGGISLGGGASFGGPMDVTGAATFGGTLTADGDATFNGAVTADDATFTGDVDITGDLTVSSITASGIVSFGSGISVDGDISATGNINADGSISSASISTGDISASGSADLSGGVSGDFSVGGDLSVAGTSYFAHNITNDGWLTTQGLTTRYIDSLDSGPTLLTIRSNVWVEDSIAIAGQSGVFTALSVTGDITATGNITPNVAP